jgi:plasmid stabilization system protein ParE
VAEIIWTVEAVRWLDEIHAYIASDNKAAAEGVVSGIFDKVQLLATQPRLGQRYELISDREVREILFGHYRIAYLVRSEERIEILGIFHAAMEIERYLS